MIAKRMRTYGPNFALFKTEDAVDCPVTNDYGAQCKIPADWDGVLAVRPANFVGWAKGKTGKHCLIGDETLEIVVTSLRVHDDGKVSAQKWILRNQKEVDRLYSQWRCFNI